MRKIGIVAGSFDPITNGHAWLIQKSADMIGDDGILHVVVGVNPTKKYYFTVDERIAQIRRVVETMGPDVYDRVTIDVIENDLLINHAKNIGASYIFRGIRNTEDFNYEAQIQQVNRRINPSVETVFFIPPSEMTEISSSTVKGLVGFQGWEQIVSQYVSDCVVNSFKEKLGNYG